jgi:hypothetical protein
MALLTVQSLTSAGAAPATLVAAAGGGDTFSNTGACFVDVANGGGSPITVTIPAQATCDQGTLHNITVTVPNAATRRIRVPAGTRYADTSGITTINYSGVTGVTVGAFSLA